MAYRVIGYVRCSTEEQHLGPVAQRNAIKVWCREHGADLLAVFEEHVSGAAELDKRNQLVAALDALEDHRATVLLVLRRDRLARDNIAAAMIDRLVERQGARVMTVDGVGNGNSPEAVLMRGIIDLFSQYERQLVRMRTKAVLQLKKAKGERTGRIPFGYHLGERGVLEENPNEQKTMALMLQYRREHLSLHEIAERLNQEGCYPRDRRGNPGRWTTPSVCRFLKRKPPRHRDDAHQPHSEEI